MKRQKSLITLCNEVIETRMDDERDELNIIVTRHKPGQREFKSMTARHQRCKRMVDNGGVIQIDYIEATL